MLFASCAGLAIAIWLTSVADNRNVLASLRSDAMVREMRGAIVANQAQMAASARAPALCELVLRNMAAAALDAVVPNTQGPNRVSNAIDAGRVTAQYQDAQGAVCTLSDIDPSNMIGRKPANTVATFASSTSGVTNSEGIAWSERASVISADGQKSTLTLRMQVLSPWLSIVRNRDVSWRVIVFYIVMINFVSVFVLVPLLVKRIKRAELAADAWTRGDLSARIDDPRTDEFGRLCDSFDHMADVLANTIQVKLALAAADERSRLAQDLHDTAKQRAFALGLQLTALKKIGPDSVQWRNITTAALTLVTHLQQDLLEVNRRLSAPTIAERGLRSALEEVIDALLAGSGTSWRLTLPEAAEQALQKAPEIARQIFLISIEASANVLKHAHASQLVMTLQQQGDTYLWTMKDDGRGFDPAAAGTMGMGLSNMRWRANTLPQGYLSIASVIADAARPGLDTQQGTVLNVSFQITGSDIL